MDMNQEFSNFIKNSELAKQFRKQQRDDLAIKRDAAIEARTPCEKELETISFTIANKNKSYNDALKHLQEAINTLTLETADQLLPLRRRRNELELEVNKHNTFLLFNYEKDIADGLIFFREKLHNALATTPNRTVATGDKKLSGETEAIIYSNRQSILNFVAYCRSAISELENMKTKSAWCDTERIETLKREIPDIREMTETTGWFNSVESMRAILGD